MSASPAAKRTARLLLVAALASTAVGSGLLLLSFGAPVPNAWGFRGFPGFFAAFFSWIGYLIATRRPRNPIGWSFLVSGALAGVQLLGTEYSAVALFTATRLPGGSFGAWLNDWIWLPLVAVGLLPVLLFFPDGRLPSRAWAPVLWISAGATAIAAAFIALSPGPLQTYGVPNPLGWDGLTNLMPFGSQSGSQGSRRAPIAVYIGLALFSVCCIAAAASLVMRFFRSRGEERQQLKWLAVSGAIVVAGLVDSFVASAKLQEIVLIVAIPSLPVAIGIAILRYRLYDIDTLINRALVYGLLTAFLAGGFVALQTGLQRFFVATTGANSDAVIVLVLFVLATLFTPLKARLQAIVDRGLKPSPAPAAPASHAGAPATPPSDRLDQIEKAFHLKQLGALTEEEFAAEKARLLG